MSEIKPVAWANPNAAPGNDCTLPARDEAILTGLAEDIVETIRSATK